ncbi:MAG: NTP transferase domain-containing protein [Deltaproteobacteria bacterium]|nr:NTP transferase domain-containing protein [Deltaproteobacteria bacterium]
MILRAVVLAAGQGTRLGGPKALARWTPRGAPWALLHARALRRRGAREVLLVLRDGVAPALGTLPSGVRVVVSHAPEALGPAGSLQAAVESLPPEGLVCVTPVDALPLTKRVHRALCAALENPEALAAVPVFQGRGGHPVLLRAEVLDPYRTEREPPTLRALLQAPGPGLRRVPVEDPRVLADLDTPEAREHWYDYMLHPYNTT